MEPAFSIPVIHCSVFDKTSKVEFKNIRLQAVPNAGDVIFIAKEGDSEFRSFKVENIEHASEGDLPARILVNAREIKNGVSISDVKGI